MSKALVFVYGTLRKGAVNSADEFVGAWHIAEDTIKGRLFDVCWYPGLSLEGDTTIKGDVFQVTEEQLLELDSYEGYPHLYNREITITGDDRLVFVYTFNESPDKFTEIPSGDWMEYKREL